MQTPSLITRDGQAILHDPAVLPQVPPQFFDPEWHREKGTVTGQAKGRGQACFLRFDGHDLVLRPYLRGGLMGRINADRFARRGAEPSRAFKEYRLLAWMRAQGLPVPHPVAALYAPKGPFYRAALATSTVEGAQPLADILHARAIDTGDWQCIGAVIRQMHNKGVDHSDLNCRNILLDADHSPWLIDFDKCTRRRAGAWQAGNLARLQRSLHKERGLHPRLHYADADWDALRTGYEAAQP